MLSIMKINSQVHGDKITYIRESLLVMGDLYKYYGIPKWIGPFSKWAGVDYATIYRIIQGRKKYVKVKEYRNLKQAIDIMLPRLQGFK